MFVKRLQTDWDNSNSTCRCTGAVYTAVRSSGNVCYVPQAFLHNNLTRRIELYRASTSCDSHHPEFFILDQFLNSLDTPSLPFRTDRQAWPNKKLRWHPLPFCEACLESNGRSTAGWAHVTSFRRGFWCSFTKPRACLSRTWYT